MTAPEPDRSDERPRARIAEARRNRQRLLDVATRAFGVADAPVSLEGIARAAGVGIGTLYRHFPTRDALVEAVYEGQMQRLHDAADQLLADHPPAAALRAWLPIFADWAVTKHGMIDSLRTLMASGHLSSGQMRAHLISIIDEILAAGAEAGDLRRDVAAEDVAATLAGVLTIAGAPDERDQTIRMLSLVADALRPMDAP